MSQTSQNKVKQITTSNNSRPILPYHVHNQADFDKSFVNGRGFIYLGISKMGFTFSVFTRVQASVLTKAAAKVNTRPLLQAAGSLLSKFLNLKVSVTNKDVAPKQRYDRFPSVGNHVHATLIFEHAWATPKHTVIAGSQKSRAQYQRLRVPGHLNHCNI